MQRRPRESAADNYIRRDVRKMIETRQRDVARHVRQALAWLLIAAAGGVLVALLVVGVMWALS
jgi:CHASE3 domain sensor protein